VSHTPAFPSHPSRDQGRDTKTSTGVYVEPIIPNLAPEHIHVAKPRTICWFATATPASPPHRAAPSPFASASHQSTTSTVSATPKPPVSLSATKATTFPHHRVALAYDQPPCRVPHLAATTGKPHHTLQPEPRH
jgi:hypothetical protein